jgi:hypothetical protein
MDSDTRYSLLSAIANDYEDLASIDKYLHFEGADLLLTHNEIGEALKQLIDEGLAEAYRLSPVAPHAQKVDFETDMAEQLWFYVTPKGEDFVRQQDQLKSPEGK